MVQLWPVGDAAIFGGASGDARMREPSSGSSYSSLNTGEFRIGNYLSRPRVGHVRMKSLWQSREHNERTQHSTAQHTYDGDLAGWLAGWLACRVAI